MKSWIRLSTVALLSMAAMACAQGTSHSSAGTFSVAVTYAAGRSGLTSGTNNFWMQGGSVEISGTAWRGLGVAANVTGLHAGDIAQGVPLSLVTTTFGPRYTWVRRRPSGRSLSFFAQGLVGEANAFRSLFPEPGAAIDSANSVAVLAGGGVDLGLRQHMSLRVVQASWLRTQLPNSTNNIQNNLVLSAGVVFHWG
jgi:hypothetical protein